MVGKFETFLKKNRLFTRKSKLLLALSGGEDSVCLFHLLREAGYGFEVAHCNFQLRDKESDGDEKFVRKLAEKYGIACHFNRFNTKQEAKKLGLNTQETARFLRYQWFEELCTSFGFAKILTAHHQDDNTETLLINLMRGTGIAGMHGIPLNNGAICRPLLGFGKEEISEYMQANGHKFRTDSSNLKDDYLRNRLRHHVMPELKKIDRHVSEAFFSTSNKVAEFERLSRALIQNQWNSTVELNNRELFVIYDRLKALDPAVLGSFLYESLRQYGFTRSQTDKLVDYKALSIGSKFVSDTHEIICERQGFILRLPDNTSLNALIIEGPKGQYRLGPVSMVLEKIRRKAVDFSQQNCLYFDLKKLEFPIIVRVWAKGDKMRPLGMKGKKKVSDLLTDKKVPNSRRKDQLVVENKSGELIALLPHTISEAYKVETDSIDVLRFKLL